MSATNDAGRLLLIPRGTYSNVTQYEVLDVVFYDSGTVVGLYVAKGTTTGNLPTDTTKWQLLIDLTGFITTTSIATASQLGIIKSDNGVTNVIDVNGMLTALGVGIVCTINPNATQYAANWLMKNNAVITPDTRQMYRVTVDGKEFLFFWNGTQYIQLSGGGHTIARKLINGSILPMAGRAFLQFDDIEVEDDSTNDTTKIKPQIRTCATETEWNQMSDAQKNNPYIHWYLPWATAEVYAFDRLPVGTVVSVTGDSTRISGNEYPTKDYLICKSDLRVNVSEYPQLAQYFADAYGSTYYFDTGGLNPGDGKFKIPDFTADYPTNGVLCIKARLTANVVEVNNVDETGLSSRTDEVPNCARVTNIENYISPLTQLRDITSDIQSDNGARLFAAIAEQNLMKYGYATGDYFESPADRTLKQQTSNASTETNATVRLRYTIADPDTYYGGYSSYVVLSTHHYAIVVDSKVTRQWHTGDVSSVGYNGCTLKSFLEGTSTGQLMTAIKADMIALFGGSTGLEHLLSHRKLYSTALSNLAWQTDKYISALTESEIYGHREWSANSYQEGEAVKPLEVFQKYRWNRICGSSIWLRNISAASSACIAYSSGLASSDSVTYTHRAVGLILLH